MRAVSAWRRDSSTTLAVTASAVAWLVILLVCGEAVARLFLTSPSIQQPDRELRYVNAANSGLFQSREGFQRLRLNKLGLNDETVGTKRPDTKRVLFIGDSMTFAAQVPTRDNFVSRIEQKLPGVETVNAGRDALGPQSWIASYRRLRDAVAPDLVVVVTTRGDAFELQNAKAKVVRNGSGEPIAVERTLNARDEESQSVGPLMRHSALLTYLARRARTQMNALTGANESWTGWLLRKGKPARPTAQTLVDPEGLTDTTADILRILKRQTPVVLVQLPAFNYLEGGTVTPADRSPLEGRIMARAAQMAAVPRIDLSAPVRADYARTGRPPAGFWNSHMGEGHLNEVGHAVVADALANALAPYVSALPRSPAS